jgi:hypothetical protein
VAIRHSIEQVQVGVVGSFLLLQRRRRGLALRLGTKREVSEVVDVVVPGLRILLSVDVQQP